MAKKTVKKAAVKKAPAKKVVKKAPAAKPAVAAAPVAPAAAPACACNGGCKCGGFGRFVKKLIVFLVIFALGFAAAKFCNHGPRFHKGPQFVNGCMDVANIKCPEMLEKVAAIDANNDGCITKEEFRIAKKEFRREGCGKDCPMRR